jgi:hypothetical protein
MAGGKETPRQKMIGMMYLVLTALLALNVSKQIIAAFITINDKLDASGQVINATNQGLYGEFDKKRAALVATKGDMSVFNLWSGKAEEMKKETAKIVGFLLSESNEMIKLAEGGQDWVESKDDEGNITALKSLMDIQAMDNYDIPTNMFIGGNPQQPIQRGLDIRNKIHEYRDLVTVMMADYKQGDKTWKFTPPSDLSGLNDALKTCNPADTQKIAQFYRSLSLPDKLTIKDGGTTKEMPWPSVMFDHAPIVAAAAMFTAMKVDIKNAESVAAEYMLGKIDAPTFNFNKIEPLAFARTGYINQGDSLGLKVMIAAYDSNEVSKIRYGINSDNPATWTETSGTIALKGATPGDYTVKGQIGVKEKGELTWKDWSFNYTVGKPTGTVSLPDMNVLYRGYDNKMQGAASGFPSYELVGSNVALTKSGDGYIAKPGAGNEASVTVFGKDETGKKVSLGVFKFRVRPLPPAQIYFGGASNGMQASKAETKLFAKYPPEIPLNVTFTVLSWELEFLGRSAKGTGGQIDAAAQALLKQARPGQTASFLVKYKGPDGGIRTGGVSVKL